MILFSIITRKLVFFVNLKAKIESNIENMQDHIHPTSSGSIKIADVILNFIKNKLPSI